MLKITFKKSMIFFGVLLLQPVLNPGSFALAKKKTPMRAYSFIAEAGKASQGECDGEKKIPKLRRLKDFSKYNAYMGSELQSPEIKSKTNDEMWKHFFRSKPDCNVALEKTPSSVNDSLKKTKVELPPDDSADSDDEPDRADGPDAE